MDLQQHSDEVMAKLAGIDRDLRSLRYTFGIVLIIVVILLAIAAPVMVSLIEGPSANSGAVQVVPGSDAASPPVNAGAPAVPAASTTATTTAQ